MSLTHFLSKSRGLRNLVARIITILSRFGISPRRFEYLLQRYIAVTSKFGLVPTFAITGVILKRYPKLVRELSQRGVEFAVHGYVHIDYKTISLDGQVKHLKKAMDTFKICEIPFVGFRAPFLRINGHTTEVLSSLGFIYDSSSIIYWNAIDLTQYSRYARSEYDRLLEFYQPRDAEEYLALPRIEDGLIQIPVSIPDDEAIMDRMRITDERTISEIWKYILQRTYSRGELFTLGLHPERIPYFENALASVIQQAKGLNPSVWAATLKEIAEWWKERDNFTFDINPLDDGRYKVKANCSDRATVLLKNSKVNVPVDEWLDGYQSVAARDFILASPTRPVIGVGRDSSTAAIKFLQGEGYVVELNSKPDNCGIFLNNLERFDEADEKTLSREIEQSDAPILRYGRWPDQARSALSVTGDIDSMTLIDFVLRIFENLLQNKR